MAEQKNMGEGRRHRQNGRRSISVSGHADGARYNHNDRGRFTIVVGTSRIVSGGLGSQAIDAHWRGAM
jgi:hypothetical protein